METTGLPPAFPIIEIAGRKLVVKFDNLARYRMSVLGIGWAEMRMFKRVESTVDMDPGIMALVLKLFACAVAGNFIDSDDPAAQPRIPSPEYWAAVIQDDRWKDIGSAVMQALVKAFPPSATAPAAVEQSGAPIQ